MVLKIELSEYNALNLGVFLNAAALNYTPAGFSKSGKVKKLFADIGKQIVLAAQQSIESIDIKAGK